MSAAQEEPNGDWRGDYESQRLLELATPELYRQNAFRVIGLPVDASQRDVARQRTRLQMMKKVGIQAPTVATGMMPLRPPPDDDQITQAAQRLNEPESRILDELFWFWPHQGNSAEDEALKLLSTDHSNAAQSLWLQYEQDYSQSRISTHNLAVYYHCIALDLEHLAERKNLGTDLNETRSRAWNAAFKRWRLLLNDEGFWSRLTARIRELDDPRLTTGTARRIRGSLPKAIFLINARLAVRAAEYGNEAEAKRHLDLMNSDGFDPSIREEVLQEAVSPVRDKVRIIRDSIMEKFAKSQAMSLNYGDSLALELLSKTQPLIKIVDVILPPGNAIRGGVPDVIADAALDCIIAFGNKSQEWQNCLPSMRDICEIAIACSESIRSRAKENLKRVEGYAEKEREYAEKERKYAEMKKAVTGDNVYTVAVSGEKISVPQGCVCCLGPANAECRTSYSWEENTGFNQRTKHTRSFNFPICTNCQQHQRELTRQRVVLVLLSVGIPAVLSYLIGANTGRMEYVPFVLMGGLFSAIAFGILARFLKVQVLKDDHAARGPAVSMGVLGQNVIFTFHNPLYAEVFAQGNNGETLFAGRGPSPLDWNDLIYGTSTESGAKRPARRATVVSKVTSKYSRGPYLLRGKAAAQVIIAAIVGAAVGQSLVFAVLDDQWVHGSPDAFRSNSYSAPTYNSSPVSQTPSYNAPYTPAPYSPPSPPAPSYVAPSTPARDDGSAAVKAEITNGKAQLAMMELELQDITSKTDSMSSQINSYKQAIDSYESQIALGESVDREAYKQAVDEHNALVQQHNVLVADYKVKYAKYKTELDRVNEMVQQYNSRLK